MSGSKPICVMLVQTFDINDTPACSLTYLDTKNTKKIDCLSLGGQMSRILELLRAEGLKLDGAKSTGPRSRVLAQADAMLIKLSRMTTHDEMNSSSSNQNWWAIKPVGDYRKVTMRYGGRVVEGSTETVEDNLDAVRETVRAMRRAVEKTTDADWTYEENRRKK
jgi:hypothetical protein